MVRIESPQNPRIKATVKLRDARERRRAGTFLVEGCRELVRGYRSGYPLSELFYCPSLLTTEGRRFIDETTRSDNSFDLLEVSEVVFEKLVMREGSDGLVGVFQQRPHDPGDLRIKSEKPLLLVLEEVEKPGNVGALFRTADAAGVDAVILTGKGADPYNPNAIRASLGTILTVPFFMMEPEQAYEFGVALRCRWIAASPYGVQPYFTIDCAGPLAVVLGSEAQGLSSYWDRPEVNKVVIPMCGVADSLNVSVAGAVILYEGLRQRTLKLPNKI